MSDAMGTERFTHFELQPDECGYCGLPVAWDGARLAYVHGEGIPNVTPPSAGDFATPGHKPGSMANPADVVTA